MKKTPIDERIAPRFEKDLTIFMELFSGSIETDSESNIVICKSLDLSSTGLQVSLDKDLPEGSILRLCLDTRSRQPIFVVAKVIWQQQDLDTKEFYVGFELLNSRGTDYDSWKIAINEMFDD